MLTIEERYKINSMLTGMSQKLHDCDSAMESIYKDNKYPATTSFILKKLGQVEQEIKDLQNFVKEINNADGRQN